ncbi:hypothetical protein E2C01_058994 [Portunus trituberculatus]|uniref:Uncharacterized protein n=1 Tax=Portunus trituberculatus TaxID=210409 RepID=A0A5B7H1B9_PORTR|nr:hypothetical protein [Portunus trituberculatus]
MYYMYTRLGIFDTQLEISHSMVNICCSPSSEQLLRGKSLRLRRGQQGGGAVPSCYSIASVAWQEMRAAERAGRDTAAVGGD